MKPVHAITIDSLAELTHEIVTNEFVSDKDSRELMTKIANLSFYPFDLAVFHRPSTKSDNKLGEVGRLNLLLGLVEEQGYSPLFSANNPGRDFIVLSEVVGGIIEGASACGFIFQSINRVDESSAIKIALNTSAGMTEQKVAGGMVALFFAIDSLLFSRGLAVATATVEYDRDDATLLLLNKVLGRR